MMPPSYLLDYLTDTSLQAKKQTEEFSSNIPLYKKESFQKGNAFIYDVYLYDFEFFVFRWKRQVC